MQFCTISDFGTLTRGIGPVKSERFPGTWEFAVGQGRDRASLPVKLDLIKSMGGSGVIQRGDVVVRTRKVKGDLKQNDLLIGLEPKNAGKDASKVLVSLKVSAPLGCHLQYEVPDEKVLVVGLVHEPQSVGSAPVLGFGETRYTGRLELHLHQQAGSAPLPRHKLGHREEMLVVLSEGDIVPVHIRGIGGYRYSEELAVVYTTDESSGAYAKLMEVGENGELLELGFTGHVEVVGERTTSGSNGAGEAAKAPTGAKVGRRDRRRQTHAQKAVEPTVAVTVVEPQPAAPGTLGDTAAVNETPEVSAVAPAANAGSANRSAIDLLEALSKQPGGFFSGVQVRK